LLTFAVVVVVVVVVFVGGGAAAAAAVVVVAVVAVVVAAVVVVVCCVCGIIHTLPPVPSVYVFFNTQTLANEVESLSPALSALGLEVLEDAWTNATFAACDLKLAQIGEQRKGYMQELQALGRDEQRKYKLVSACSCSLLAPTKKCCTRAILFSCAISPLV
jgi:hypothetical protein